MKVTCIEAGRFKLDGGAMFGVVPKSIWNTLNPANDHNMCTWSMRSILIETGSRKILVDTGIGFKQGAKFRAHFHPHGSELSDSLGSCGINEEEITDVFLTHFHFDHNGGAVRRDEKDRLIPTFPNATYWSNEVHYAWADQPNPREAASFLAENHRPLVEHGVLRYLDYQKDDLTWLPGIKVRFVDGHTLAQMILFIETENETLVYPADLIPSTWHLRLPYIMAYDIQPLLTLEEKTRLLEGAVEHNYRLIFEHDPITESCLVEKDEKGRFTMKR